MILANFDGKRFVTQFLPIAPQPPIRLMLVAARSRHRACPGGSRAFALRSQDIFESYG